jgi:hypothetical protein
MSNYFHTSVTTNGETVTWIACQARNGSPQIIVIAAKAAIHPETTLSCSAIIEILKSFFKSLQNAGSFFFLVDKNILMNYL